MTTLAAGTLRTDSPDTLRAIATSAPVAYERISKFRVTRNGLDTEVSRGVSRQTADNDACAEALGLGTVAVHFTDDGISASQFATRARDGWLAMLDHVRAGHASHVIVWLLDRAARTTEGTESLLRACREGGALIVQSATHDVADPHNPDDIFRLKLAGLLAEYEVAKMSVRQRRSKSGKADKGEFHGGPRRFGFEDGMTALRADEARAVRKIVDDVLAGGSLGSAARYLNENGYPGTRGGTWSSGNVRHLLLRPHLAKLRVHHGETLAEASWDAPAILTPQEHRALVAILTDPARKSHAGTNARVHLLSGLMRCGVCDGPVRAARTKSRGKAADGSWTYVYRCADNYHVVRPAAPVDLIVETAVVARLERMRPDGILATPETDVRLRELDDEARVLEQRIESVQDDYDEDRVTADDYRRKKDKAVRALAAVRSEQSRLARPVSPLVGLAGQADAAELWAGFELDRRRAVIQALMSVTLSPGPSRRSPFRPEQVTITWRVG